MTGGHYPRQLRATYWSMGVLNYLSENTNISDIILNVFTSFPHTMNRVWTLSNQPLPSRRVLAPTVLCEAKGGFEVKRHQMERE